MSTYYNKKTQNVSVGPATKQSSRPRKFEKSTTSSSSAGAIDPSTTKIIDLATAAKMSKEVVKPVIPLGTTTKTVEAHMNLGMIEFSKAKNLDDKLDRLEALDRSRMHFRNANYAAGSSYRVEDTIALGRALAEVTNMLNSEYGIRGDEKSLRDKIAAKIKELRKGLQNVATKSGMALDVARNGVVDVVVESTVPLKYPPFVKPKESDMATATMVENLVNLRRFNPVKSLVMPWNQKKGFKYNAVSTQAKPDKIVYAFLAGKGLGSKLQPALDSVRCNGTMAGLYQRMAQNMVDPKIADKFKPIERNLALMISRILPHDRNQLKTIKLSDYKRIEFEGPNKSPSMSYINALSDAGFPYAFEQQNGIMPKVSGTTSLSKGYSARKMDIALNTGVRSILDHAGEKANEILEKLSGYTRVQDIDAAWREILIHYPELAVFILKRKSEKISRDDYMRKVRPYGVQPLPMRLVCKHILYPFESSLKSFWEDSESISAYRFSPFSGGAKRLVEHLATKAAISTPDGLSAVSYGDDQLWLISLNNGNVLCWCPDVKSMDMSTPVVHAFNYARILAYAYPEVDAQLKALVSFITIMAFQHNIFVGDTYIIQKLHSLISGIPGTTYHNLHSSAAMIVRTRLYLAFLRSLEDQSIFEPSKVNELMSKLETNITKSMGYTFKKQEGTFLVYPSLESFRERGIEVPFLSAKYIPVDGHIMAVPAEMDKFSASLVCPDSNEPSNTLRMCVIVGIFITGAWIDPVWEKVLRELYSHLYNASAEIDNPDFHDLDDGVAQFILEIGFRMSWHLPSRQFMIDFNTISREEMLAKYPKGWADVEVGPKVAEVVQAKDELTEAVMSNTTKYQSFEFDFATVGVSTNERRAAEPIDSLIARELNTNHVEAVKKGLAKPKNVKLAVDKTTKTVEVKIRNPSLYANTAINRLIRTTPMVKPVVNVVQEASTVAEAESELDSSSQLVDLNLADLKPSHVKPDMDEVVSLAVHGVPNALSFKEKEVKKDLWLLKKKIENAKQEEQQRKMKEQSNSDDKASRFVEDEVQDEEEVFEDEEEAQEEEESDTERPHSRSDDDYDPSGANEQYDDDADKPVTFYDAQEEDEDEKAYLSYLKKHYED